MTDDKPGWGGGIWAAADLLTPMAVRVAATLRLADHIAAGMRTVEALAPAAHAEPDALARVMNHLVTAGVLSRTGDGVYALTELGEQLRDDHPEGMRAWLDLEGAIGRADLCFTQLLHTVRTGEAAYPRQFGRPYWDDLAADPRLAASFDALMGSRLVDGDGVAAAYPWGELGHVVDVGGGNGTLLIALLRAHAGLRGTVVDLAGAAARAEEAFAELGGRAEARAGSFFEPLPPGAGGYLLSGVLHDWDDESAVRILERCAEAAGADGRVIVIEDGDGGAPDTEGDLRMLCYVRGRNRTPDQIGVLGRAAGLELGPVRVAGLRMIIELRPVPRRLAGAGEGDGSR
ncbi:methyltransferase [Nucisporomicrobium flavum]|uniref:methyltransferase n=1 Tax=Nucisporomicrobium flavum TaxID=2785915 RepID=UPI0018F4BE4F|nr:methyltransferase [Nucisporomicrobium flavum]